jgi:hypothetical protein
MMKTITFGCLLCSLAQGLSYRTSGLREPEVKQTELFFHSAGKTWFIFQLSTFHIYEFTLIPTFLLQLPWLVWALLATRCFGTWRVSRPCTLGMIQWHQCFHDRSWQRGKWFLRGCHICQNWNNFSFAESTMFSEWRIPKCHLPVSCWNLWCECLTPQKNIW